MPQWNAPPSALHGIVANNMKYVWNMVQAAVEKTLWRKSLREETKAILQDTHNRESHNREWDLLRKIHRGDNADFRSFTRETKANPSEPKKPVPSPSPQAPEPWEGEVVYFFQEHPPSPDSQPAYHLSRDLDTQKGFNRVGLGLDLLKDETDAPLEPYRCSPLGIKCVHLLDGPGYVTQSAAEKACDANPDNCIAIQIVVENYPIRLCASNQVHSDKYNEYSVCKRARMPIHIWEPESYKYDGTYDQNISSAGAHGYDYEDTYDDVYAYPYQDSGYDYTYDDGDFYSSEKPWIEATDYTYDDDDKILTGYTLTYDHKIRNGNARSEWERYNAAELPSDEELKKMVDENLVNILTPGSYDSSDHLRPPPQSKLWWISKSSAPDV